MSLKCVWVQVSSYRLVRLAFEASEPGVLTVFLGQSPTGQASTSVPVPCCCSHAHVSVFTVFLLLRDNLSLPVVEWWQLQKSSMLVCEVHISAIMLGFCPIMIRDSIINFPTSLQSVATSCCSLTQLGME